MFKYLLIATAFAFSVPSYAADVPPAPAVVDPLDQVVKMNADLAAMQAQMDVLVSQQNGLSVQAKALQQQIDNSTAIRNLYRNIAIGGSAVTSAPSVVHTVVPYHGGGWHSYTWRAGGYRAWRRN